MSKVVGWVEPTDVKKGVPKYAMRAYLSDRGRVFVAARVTGNEKKALLCASFDGVEFVTDGGVYLPVDWLVEEYPETAENLRAVEAKVREVFGV